MGHPLYVESKKNDTNELAKWEETHRLRKPIYGC